MEIFLGAVGSIGSNDDAAALGHEAAADLSAVAGGVARQRRGQRAVQPLRLLDARIDPLEGGQLARVGQVCLGGVGGAHLIDQALVGVRVLQQEEGHGGEASRAGLAGGQPEVRGIEEELGRVQILLAFERVLDDVLALQLAVETALHAHIGGLLVLLEDGLDQVLDAVVPDEAEPPQLLQVGDDLADVGEVQHAGDGAVVLAVARHVEGLTKDQIGSSVNGDEEE